MREPTAERRAVTVSEAAVLAGASTATVRGALSEPAPLRAGTLARVTEAVQQTGCRPNIAARTLRAGRTMLALVAVPDIANPFLSDMLRSIEGALSGQGYGLLIGSLDSRAGEAQMTDVVRAGR